ncbi:MAG: dicarboxylate/amino acid:cation symporter [Ignavibacteria bacterium]|nr:dicarboxylate/amino acid:cation symporter [Ignavibacteria bacterium]
MSKGKFKIKLHTKIVIGLILGILFGSYFHIDQKRLEIKSKTGEAEVNEWSSFQFLKKDSVIKSFNNDDQLIILKYFNGIKDASLKKELKIKIEKAGASPQIFEDIKEVSKVKTIGVLLKPVGDIFIRLLNMIAVPLVLASLIVGAASLSDIKHIAKIGGKTLGFYALTAVLAIAIGLTFANIIRPGHIMSPDAKQRLLDAYQDDAKTKIDQNVSLNITEFLVNIVPKNPFKAIADGDFLQIVFFAILTGIFLTQINKEKSREVISFFEGISDAMILLVEKVMHIAPYAVFTLIAATVAEFGFGIVKTLLWYSLTVIAGLTVLTFVEYPLLLKLFTKVKIKDFFVVQKQVLAVAFSTSSSAATLPVTMDVCEKKLGVPNKIASFVLPLGTTVNMDGTALYQAVAAMFIAQVYGFDLNLSQQLTIVLTAALAAVGTAPVPGVGLIMLIIVLRSVGIPEEGIALIIGVDRLLDMCRTIPNVLADSLACVVIASSEKELGKINLSESE